MRRTTVRRICHLTARGAIVASVLGLSGCSGPGIDYPDAPPVPDSARVVATDTGQDNDDPIRLQAQVVELGEAAQADAVAFYKRAYPESEGWQPERGADDQMLCLVNRSDDGHTAFLDVFDYTGRKFAARSDRLLVLSSQFSSVEGNGCGSARAWAPTGFA